MSHSYDDDVHVCYNLLVTLTMSLCHILRHIPYHTDTPPGMQLPIPHKTHIDGLTALINLVTSVIEVEWEEQLTVKEGVEALF